MTDIVLETQSILGFAEELSKIACSGGGVKALTVHLGNKIQAAVLVEDSEWRHLALGATGGRSVPASVRDLVAQGRGEPNGIVYFSPPGGTEGVSLPIGAGESLLGRISLIGTHPATPAHLAYARLTASSIAVELSREQGSGKNRRKSFWDRLLAHAYEDPIEARDDASSRGILLAPGYVAVAIEAEGLDESSATAKHVDLRRICLETLRTGTNEIVVIERGSGFVFLCPTALEVDAANARIAAALIPKTASKTLSSVKLVGGIGRYADAVDTARTVEQAREALFVTRRIYGTGRVVDYDTLGIYPLLLRSGVTREDWRAMSARILATLRAYDTKHQTDLLRTLRLYFDVGENVKTAAAELNVHRHTVFYRLRQIAEISNLSLASAHDQLTLRAAMAVDALYA